MVRGRKSEITLEMARDWLERLEERGRTIRQIAKEVNYTAKTVSRALEMARQERDQRMARQNMLQDVLRDHHRDLTRFVEKLVAGMGRLLPPGELYAFPVSDPIWSALRQHLAGHPLWQSVANWNDLAPVLRDDVARLSERITKEAPKTLDTGFNDDATRIGLNPGLTACLTYHLWSLAQGGTGMKEIELMRVTAPGGAALQHSAYRIFLVAEADFDRRKNAYEKFLDAGKEWEEYRTLVSHAAKLVKVRDLLKEDLQTIVLRRVLPGHCRYCPF